MYGSSGVYKSNGRVFYGSWGDSKIVVCDIETKN